MPEAPRVAHSAVAPGIPVAHHLTPAGRASLDPGGKASYRTTSSPNRDLDSQVSALSGELEPDIEGD